MWRDVRRVIVSTWNWLCNESPLSSALPQECGLLRKGTVLLADNVICPGAPEYLKYIRNNPRYESRYYPAHLEYTKVEDGLEKSIFLG